MSGRGVGFTHDEGSQITRETITRWIQAYEAAWRTPGTESARELFTETATYQMSPFESRHIGLDAIAVLWERERDGPDEQFTIASEIVCVEPPVAVVRVEVHYAAATPRHYRDLWILRFAPGGRCEAFEEWPFWPGQPLTP